jgi:hypothetical protein
MKAASGGAGQHVAPSPFFATPGHNSARAEKATLLVPPFVDPRCVLLVPPFVDPRCVLAKFGIRKMEDHRALPWARLEKHLRMKFACCAVPLSYKHGAGAAHPVHRLFRVSGFEQIFRPGMGMRSQAPNLALGHSSTKSRSPSTKSN